MSILHGQVARRYELDVPLRYRLAGDPDWHDGRAVNASRTGVLFQTTGEGFEAGTAIELQLELPGATRPSKVHCTGAVVRCSRESSNLRVAATIEAYRFCAENGTVVEDV